MQLLEFLGDVTGMVLRCACGHVSGRPPRPFSFR
jgi:hypothetical protein